MKVLRYKADWDWSATWRLSMRLPERLPFGRQGSAWRPGTPAPSRKPVAAASRPAGYRIRLAGPLGARPLHGCRRGGYSMGVMVKV